MFEVGDYVKIKDECNNRRWYNNETYIISETNVNFNEETVRLNKDIIVNGGNWGNEIDISYIELDLVYYRKDKINKIKKGYV